MSDETKPDAICAALRDRLADLRHQRDLAEIAVHQIDARIAEVTAMLEEFAPKRSRGRAKGTGMRIAVVPEPSPETPEPEDAA